MNEEEKIIERLKDVIPKFTPAFEEWFKQSKHFKFFDDNFQKTSNSATALMIKTLTFDGFQGAIETLGVK